MLILKIKKAFLVYNFVTKHISRKLLNDISLILLGAGDSTRFNQRVKKQWIRIGDDPLWLFVTKNFKEFGFKKIIITSNAKELKYMCNYAPFTFVEGGETRQESLKNALSKIDTKFVMVSDIARALIPKKMIKNIIKARKKADIVVPYLKAVDTVVYENETIDRDRVKLIQTPQLSRTKILKKSLLSKKTFTDDSSAIKAIGGSCHFVEGNSRAKKITYLHDLLELNLPKNSKDFFIGHGLDVHDFIEGDHIVLGGVKIPAPFSFKAHSDGDVLIHALIDSLLGAIGAGDIGELFPDSDAKYKGIDSTILLRDVVEFVRRVGYDIVNIDVTIIAQTPKLSAYKREMRENLADILGILVTKVNIKATTTEKKGFVGRGEAIVVEAVANLKYFDWNKK